MMKEVRRLRMWLKITAIVFGAAGILSLYFSVRVNSCDNAIIIETKKADGFANHLKLIRYSDRRVFSGTLYPRSTLDSLEQDYSNYADWIDLHKDYIDMAMGSKDSVDLSMVGTPCLHSSLSHYLESFRKEYVECMLNYNTCVGKINKYEDSKKMLEGWKTFFDGKALLLLIISFFLEIGLAFFDYYSVKH